jgi:uncharacterized protein (TIRG00374 family)
MLVINAAPHDDLVAAWNAVDLQTLLLASACFAAAALTNVYRWQILLRSQNINQSAMRLTEVFFIGLFCALFLPTAAGGDAYRVYAVARRAGSTGRVLLATLQDRLLGLGPTMTFGLVGAYYYYDLFPGNLVVPVLIVCVLGIMALVVLWHLGHVIHLATRMLAKYPLPALLRQWSQGRLGARIIRGVAPLGQAPPLNLWRTCRAVGLALATFFSAVAMYAVVCSAFQISCAFLALCWIVALVGVARMLPISLGGNGVSEGAFVYLAGLFGIGHGKAVPVALVILFVCTLMSLLGGLLLLRRTLLGTQAPELTTIVSIPRSEIVKHEALRNVA